MARNGVRTPGVVVREPDYSQLCPEDRAQLVKTQMHLKASVEHIRAHAKSMLGAVLCGNALIDTDLIEDELIAMDKEMKITMAQVRKLKLLPN